VFDELCRIVEDAVDLYHREARPLPRALRAAHPGVRRLCSHEATS
jgi:hypothetical protein